MIIRAVYLEKTHTMKKMKKDQELACIGFRKWVIEQKKKTKKDPLPLARIEVSKVRFPGQIGREVPLYGCNSNELLLSCDLLTAA